MSNLQNVLGELKLATIKKFVSLLPKSRKNYGKAIALVKEKRDKIETRLPADFSWSELYELEAKQMFILTLASLGYLEGMVQAARAGLNLNQFLIDEATRSSEDENEEVEWSGGHKGLFCEADIYSITHAAQISARCLGIYGFYLNELVAQVRKGGKDADNAYFKAVMIDRTVLTCPTFAARLARAEFFSEKNFILRLRKAFKGKPHDSLLIHQDLRTLLQFFHEINTINSLTLNEADLLLIQELKIYQDKGDDPARSLMRFIQRWKAAKHTAT
ncbi:MAG: hypothetical protein DID92_2727744758 [Candidatus Nitrotoga sp. SPKER]|nr:MAG: hypothetical protein DID92_2727744758 [Candidatus Nitrotoga sp. SPKER]